MFWFDCYVFVFLFFFYFWVMSLNTYENACTFQACMSPATAPPFCVKTMIVIENTFILLIVEWAKTIISRLLGKISLYNFSSDCSNRNSILMMVVICLSSGYLILPILLLLFFCIRKRRQMVQDQKKLIRISDTNNFQQW